MESNYGFMCIINSISRQYCKIQQNNKTKQMSDNSFLTNEPPTSRSCGQWLNHCHPNWASITKELNIVLVRPNFGPTLSQKLNCRLFNSYPLKN